jgi:FkbM family methyltransferase
MTLKKLLVRVVQCLPSKMINWIGAAQFRYPLLAPLIRKVGGAIRDTEGVISAGAAKGLRFNGKYGFPGYLLGTTEPEQQRWLVKNVSEGDVVYEIGANVGFFSLLCGGLTGPKGRVEAFEPNPICASACRHNVSLNNFNHIGVHEIALSDSVREVLFQCPDESTALGKISSERGGKNSGAEMLIRTEKLDDYVGKMRLRAPTLLIIDVEGHEIEVLKGARQIIKQYRPKINCEIHWLGDTFLHYFALELHPLGYRLENIDLQAIPTMPTRWQAIMFVAHSD